MVSLLNEVSALMMEDTEKVDLLNNFDSGFTVPWETQTLEVRESLGKGKVPLGQGRSCRLESHKSTPGT